MISSAMPTKKVSLSPEGSNIRKELTNDSHTFKHIQEIYQIQQSVTGQSNYSPSKVFHRHYLESDENNSKYLKRENFKSHDDSLMGLKMNKNQSIENPCGRKSFMDEGKSL
jgi:hypothetical protein